MITKEKRKNKTLLTILAALLVISAAFGWHYEYDDWGYYWKVSNREAALRNQFVRTAEKYLGANEADGSHARIIDLYNSHEPLALDYHVKYTDSWCSAFVSAIAIQCNITEIIPTECGCERHIALFQEIGCWEEDDNIIPLPGDLVFYDWDRTRPGEASGWSDHVGIVVGTKWPFIKVIEGNKDDTVAYRVILIGNTQIRGFAKPDYESLLH